VNCSYSVEFFICGNRNIHRGVCGGCSGCKTVCRIIGIFHLILCGLRGSIPADSGGRSVIYNLNGNILRNSRCNTAYVFISTDIIGLCSCGTVYILRYIRNIFPASIANEVEDKSGLSLYKNAGSPFMLELLKPDTETNCAKSVQYVPSQ